MAPLLEVRDLRIEFETEDGIVTAVVKQPGWHACGAGGWRERGLVSGA